MNARLWRLLQKGPQLALLGPVTALLSVAAVVAVIVAAPIRAILAPPQVSLVAASAVPWSGDPAAEAESSAAAAGLVHSDMFGRHTLAPDSGAGDATGPTILPAPPAAELPEAMLGLSLQGIVYRSASRDRLAIVGGQTTPSAPYRIGDTVAEDAVIRFIGQRRIVIEHKGALAALTLPDPDPGAAASHRVLRDTGAPPGMMMRDF